MICNNWSMGSHAEIEQSAHSDVAAPASLVQISELASGLAATLERWDPSPETPER